MRRWMLLALLTGCGSGSDAETVFIAPSTDVDADGVLTPDDCNDFDAQVQPGMAEVCNNGLDDDCNGDLDCADASCSGSALCVPPESCDDGIDNDGNGAVDCADDGCLYSAICQDCSPSLSLECGQSASASLATGGGSLSNYSCSPGSAANTEVVYAFTANSAGTVRFTADPEDPFLSIGGLDVNTYVLKGGCRVDQCEASSASGALGTAETTEVTVAAGDQLYFVVERVSGLSAAVEISVSCF